MVQVVTSENMQQLIETGSVPEFVPPAATPTPPETPAPTESKASEPARGDDGKFVKKDAQAVADKAEPESKDAGKPEGDDEGGDANLTEHARKVIGKKHRAMKEAEEFGKQQYLERRAAEQRAEELERENAQLKTKSRPAPEKSEAPKEQPKPDDFKSVAEYVDALTDWKLGERDRKAAQERADEAEGATVRAHAERVTKAKAEIPDFEDVVRQADSDVPSHLSQAIINSELGPQLIYHLAKHPDELKRLVNLSPIRGIAELGKLETKLESKPAAAEKPAASAPAVSKAPAPITPIDTSSATPAPKKPEEMTFQELREYDRQQRMLKARR